MKRVCALLVAAVALSIPAAAPADGGYSPADGGLAGRQAVQFSVGSHLSLSEFQGQMFSYQKFLTDSRAIRVAGGLFLDLDDSDLEVEYYSGNTTGSAELSEWVHRGTLKVQMLFYRGDGPIRFFWGAGPKISYTDIHSEDVNYSPDGDELQFVYFTRDIDIWEFGIQGFAGVEWFINPMFSVHAEYGASGKYKFEDKVDHRIYSYDSDSNRKIATTTRSPEFVSDGVRVGLSARF
jgi:opacity protein-like surface antigen